MTTSRGPDIPVRVLVLAQVFRVSPCAPSPDGGNEEGEEGKVNEVEIAVKVRVDKHAGFGLWAAGDGDLMTPTGDFLRDVYEDEDTGHMETKTCRGAGGGRNVRQGWV